MCTSFTCTACHLTFYNRCKDVEFDPKASCPNTTIIDNPTKCNTCQTIKAAIKKLESLVFRLPFLETEGAAGIGNLCEWERESAEMLLSKYKGGDVDDENWANKAESREERRKGAKTIEKMGLGGMEDAREEHQGFTMSLTPEKKEKKEDEE